MSFNNNGFRKLKDDDMDTVFDHFNENENILNPELVRQPANRPNPTTTTTQQQPQQPESVVSNNSNNNIDRKNYKTDLNTESTIVEEETNFSVMNNKDIPQVDNNKLNIKKQERIYWLDCLRVVACYCIIIVQCSNVLLKPSINYKNFNGKVLIAYCSFLRPFILIFMMISGTLFLNPRKNITLKNIMNKYVPRILKLYIFWTLFYGIIDKYIIKYDNKSISFSKGVLLEIIKNCIIRGGSHLWYLNYTLGAYLTVPIYRSVVRDRSIGWYLVALCCILTQIVPTIHEFCVIVFGIDLQVIRNYIDNLFVYTAGNYLGYFVLGYMISTQNFKKSYIYLAYLIGLIGNVLTVVFRLMACHHYDKNAYNLSRYYNFNLCMGAVGIFVFFKYAVSGWVKSRSEKFIKILTTLSECTRGVYLIHLFIYHVFTKLHFHSQLLYPLVWVPIYSFIVFGVSLGIVYLLRRVPFVKHIL